MRQAGLCAALLLATHCLPMTAWADEKSCADSEVRVPVVFQFADSDVREAWIYDSTYPRLLPAAGAVAPVAPIATSTHDGSYRLAFCADRNSVATGFRLRFGPRIMAIATRPIDGSAAQSVMATINVLKQPRPDWLVVRSVKRLEAASDGLPVFDIDFYNFGKPHPGADVRLDSEPRLVECYVSKAPITVPIEIAAAGSRLRVASADPDYPEMLITRATQADLPKCGYPSILAELGSTAALPEGPSRFRYRIRRGRITGNARETMDARPSEQARVFTPMQLDEAIRDLQMSASAGYEWAPRVRSEPVSLIDLLTRSKR